METVLTLLFTDLVDSTAINARMGDEAMARLWLEHDAVARELAHDHHGREFERSDGFLMVFDRPSDAVAFASAYHRRLAGLSTPLQARVGIHVGQVLLRQNDRVSIARGAGAVDLFGLAKAWTARLMGLAGAGQSLVSAQLAAAVAPLPCVSHGYWRFKGLDEPVEIFAVGEATAPCTPPRDGEKAFRVVRVQGEWVGLSHVPHRLPAESDACVGREQDLRVLSHLAADPECRLVVLHGTGGVGKTRLALRFAWGWLGQFPGGAYFCDFAAERGLDGLLHTVALALDVPLGADPIGQLSHAIAARGFMLLVLDNFEHVAAHARETIGTWMASAPQALFMVTSRASIGLAGERTVNVAPLKADDAKVLLTQLANYQGVELDGSPETDAKVGELVQMLDGLPLAIQLAAGRLRTMTPEQMVQRMHQRFTMLASRGGRVERQTTLKASIDASWDALSVDEQTALAELSVFVGGFDLAAAEAIIGRVGTQDPPTFEVLASLVDNSLLRRLEGSRLGMLNAIQAYAAERLEVDVERAPAAWRRHWSHYGGFDDERALADRSADLGNLIAACRRALEAGCAEDAADCIVPAWSALRLGGPFGVATRLAEQLSAMQEAGPLVHLVASWVQAAAAFASGDIELADGTSTEARALLCTCSAPSHLSARVHCTLSEIARAAGRLEMARDHLAAALIAARAAGRPWLLSQVLNGLGLLAAGQGDFEGAARHYAEALQVARDHHISHWEGGILGNIAVVEHARGSLDAAEAALQASLHLAAQSGDRRWAGNALCNLGLLHLERGDLTRSEDCLKRACQTAAELGHRKLELTARCNLALLYERTGELAQAVEEHDCVVNAAVALGDQHGECEFRIYQISAAIRLGRFTNAGDSLRRGLALVQVLGEPALRGRLCLCRAEFHAAQCDRTTAVSAWDEAREIFSQLGLSADSEFGQHLAAVKAVIRC